MPYQLGHKPSQGQFLGQTSFGRPSQVNGQIQGQRSFSSLMVTFKVEFKVKGHFLSGITPLQICHDLQAPAQCLAKPCGGHIRESLPEVGQPRPRAGNAPILIQK